MHAAAWQLEMGAGRKTETVSVNGSGANSSGFFSDGGTVPHRNLPLHQLGSVVFGCQPETQNECLSNSLFGLPSGHLKYVKNIKEGMPLFLFNFTDRLMYGVFEATGPGNANISPHAWTGDAKGKTSFPAQVPVKIRKLFDPLHEDAFRKVIFENYYMEGKFHFELDKHQTQNLIRLFVTGPPKGFGSSSESRPPVSLSKKSSKGGASTAESSKNSEALDGWILPKKTARKALATANADHGEKISIRLPEELTYSGFRNLKDEGAESEETAEIEDEVETFTEIGNGNIDGWSECFDDTSSHRAEEWGGALSGSWKDQKENLEEPVFYPQDRVESKRAAATLVKKSLEDSQTSLAVAETFDSQPSLQHTWTSEEKQEMSGRQGLNAAKFLRFSHMKDQNEPETICEFPEKHSANGSRWTDNPSYSEIVSNEANRKDFVVDAFQRSAGTYADKVVQSKTHSTFSEKHSANGSRWTDNPSYSEIVSNEANRKDFLVDEFQRNAGTYADEVVQSQTQSTFSEWDGQAGENSNEKQRISEEQTSLSFTLQKLESVIASEVQKNMESYTEAVAKIRTYETELSHIISEARSVMEPLQELENLRLRNNFLEKTLAAQLDALSLEVSELRSQLNAPGRSSGLVTDYISPARAMKSFDSSEVYLLGGYNGKFCLNDVQVYSCFANQLKLGAPMLSPRSCAAATVLESRIFIFGGMGEGSWVDSVHMYEKARDDWIPCAPMQIKRGSLAGVTVGEHIFALGGRGNGIAAAFSEVEYFSPHSGSWMSTTTMLEKRCFLAAAAHGGSIYAVGGNNGVSYLETAERFDPREGIWKKLPSMSNKRGWLSSAFFKGKLYALGGFDGIRYLASAEVFDPRACRWEPSCSMNSERALGAAAISDESIYMVGGGPNSTEYHDFFERFDEASGWHIIRPDNFCGRALLAVAIL
ncbi:hypothetical protein O6H91_12G015300 [Diphasiastrum complanatum]|nr:hypothetical protein O6H91_12G015300 [Diphasiastrum complanatum]